MKIRVTQVKSQIGRTQRLKDTLEGLTAIVSIKHPEPQFESQTKVKLMNTDAKTAVE